MVNFHFCVIFLCTSCIPSELFLRISFRPFACAHLTSNFHAVFFSTLWILMLNISSKLNCDKCHAPIRKMSKFFAIHPQSLCVGVKICLLHQIWVFFDSHNMKFLNCWLCGEDPACITNGWILRSEQDLRETTCPNRLQFVVLQFVSSPQMTCREEISINIYKYANWTLCAVTEK